MPSISALVLVTAVDAVRRNRKALVSSRVGLSGVVVGDDIEVKVDKIVLEGSCKIGENDTTWMFGFKDVLQGYLPNYTRSQVQQD